MKFHNCHHSIEGTDKKPKNDVEKNFECEICQAKFKKNSQLKNHKASVHEEIKPFNCKLCDYSCAIKGNFDSKI